MHFCGGLKPSKYLHILSDKRKYAWQEVLITDNNRNRKRNDCDLVRHWQERKEVYINNVWYTWNNKKQNTNTYLDHSQWKMTIIFSLTSTYVLKFIAIPHRKLGVSEPGFGNQNELTGFRKLSFSFPHTDLTIKFSFRNNFYWYREEVWVLRKKKFQRNRVPAKYFSRQLGEQQSKLYSPSRKSGHR